MLMGMQMMNDMSRMAASAQGGVSTWIGNEDEEWSRSGAASTHRAAPSSENEMIIGHVKSYNPLKGFGFIASNSVDGDIYFKGSFQQIQGRPVSFKLVNRAGKKSSTECRGP